MLEMSSAKCTPRISDHTKIGPRRLSMTSTSRWLSVAFAHRCTTRKRILRTISTEITAAANTTAGMRTENGSRSSVRTRCINPLFSCTNVGDRTSTDLMACVLRNLWRAGRLLGWALLAVGFGLSQISHDLDSPAETAAALAKKAKKSLKAGDSTEAYIFYSEASALQPKNRRYRTRMEALQA